MHVATCLGECAADEVQRVLSFKQHHYIKVQECANPQKLNSMVSVMANGWRRPSWTSVALLASLAGLASGIAWLLRRFARKRSLRHLQADKTSPVVVPAASTNHEASAEPDVRLSTEPDALVAVPEAEVADASKDAEDSRDTCPAASHTKSSIVREEPPPLAGPVPEPATSQVDSQTCQASQSASSSTRPETAETAGTLPAGEAVTTTEPKAGPSQEAGRPATRKAPKPSGMARGFLNKPVKKPRKAENGAPGPVAAPEPKKDEPAREEVKEDPKAAAAS